MGSSFRRPYVVAGALLLTACAPRPTPRSTLAEPAPPLTAPPVTASTVPQVPPPAANAEAVAQAIGTQDPLVLEAASAAGTWAALCQARRDSDGDGRIATVVGDVGELRGDDLESYLVLGVGLGDHISELASFDPSGRFVVVVRDRRALLVDSKTRKTTELTDADVRSDGAPFRAHRAFSFDGAGMLLAYVRRSNGRPRVLVRQLLTGREREVDPGAGELWRIELSADGRWVTLQMIIDDTNRNGRLEWPVPEVSRNRWRCQGPVPHYDAWLGHGDALQAKIASATGGPARLVPGLAVTLGEALVLRDAQGRLLLEDGGQLSELANDKCGARVFHSDAERSRLLIACVGATSPGGRPELELVSKGSRHKLGVRIAPFVHDRRPEAPRRLLPVYSGRDTMLIDLERHNVTLLQPGDIVVDTHDTLALVQRASELVVVDAAQGGAASKLPGKVQPHGQRLSAGGVAVVEPIVVHVPSARVLGSVVGRPLAVAPDGRVLIAQGAQATSTSLAVGPLVWQRPGPLSAPATP
jgi:hypothetical protein